MIVFISKWRKKESNPSSISSAHTIRGAVPSLCGQY
jgi:hypothetical protein